MNATHPKNYTVAHRRGKWAEARSIRDQLRTVASQAETAKALGVSRSYVEVLELETLMKVAHRMREAIGMRNRTQMDEQ